MISRADPPPDVVRLPSHEALAVAPPRLPRRHARVRHFRPLRHPHARPRARDRKAPADARRYAIFAAAVAARPPFRFTATFSVDSTLQDFGADGLTAGATQTFAAQTIAANTTDTYNDTAVFGSFRSHATNGGADLLDTFTVNQVPEPGTIGLFGIGAVALRAADGAPDALLRTSRFNAETVVSHGRTRAEAPFPAPNLSDYNRASWTKDGAMKTLTQFIITAALLAVPIGPASPSQVAAEPPAARAAKASLSAADLDPLLKVVQANAAARRVAGGDKWLAELVTVQAALGDLTGAEATAKKVKFPYEAQANAQVLSLRAAKQRAAAADAAAAEVRRQKLHALDEKLAVEVARTEAQAGRLPAARAIAGLFEPGVYASGAWLAIATASGQKADLDKAMASFRRPPEEDDLAPVAEAQAACGDTAAALKTAERIRTESFRAGALARAARARARRGDVDGAKSAAAAIKPDNINHVNWAWSSVAAALAEKGDVEGTRAALANAQKTMDYAVVLAILPYAQAKAGDVDGAKSAAAALKKQQYKAAAATALAHGLIARALADRGDAAGARLSIEESARAAAGNAEAALPGLSAALFGPEAVESVLTAVTD
jgi:hypothetical protein